MRLPRPIKKLFTRILTITINHLFFKPSINFGLGIVARHGIAPPLTRDANADCRAGMR